MHLRQFGRGEGQNNKEKMMDQIKDVYVLDDEIKRLKNQNQLLEEYEGPVYNIYSERKEGRLSLILVAIMV